LADIFTRKNMVFLHVKIYGFSQWQKSLQNTDVYIIKMFISRAYSLRRMTNRT